MQPKMDAAIENCPRCGVRTDEHNHRLVTDSCGHKKCRRCFLVDEVQCSVCKQLQEEEMKEKKEKEQRTLNNAQQQNVNVETENKGKRSTKKTAAKPMPAHIQQVPTSKPGEFHYHCSHCDKSFRSRSQRYYHFDCGNESAKKHKCTHCERAFGSRSHLNYHLESHTAQVHRCGQCDMTFNNQRVMLRHQKRHETLPINCPECGKQFRCKEYLATHLELHRNNLRFECAICGRKYALKTALRQHMQKHLEKRYACNYCGKHFQRNSTLNLHLKRHKKIQSFCCKTCTKIFSDTDSLKRHSKIHEEAAPKYKCMHCDLSSMRKDNMLRHVRNMHLGEDFNSCVEMTKDHNVPEKSKTQSTFVVRVESGDASGEEILTEDEDIEEEEGGAKEQLYISQLPKAIENSCVIRCVGNVEPVRIPNTSNDLNEYAAVVQPVEETTAAMPPTLINLENANFNYIETATHTHIPIKKKYDPIELYRKILMSDEEEVAAAEALLEANSSALTVHAEATETGANMVQQQATEAAAKPRSEMHWRKNFKYTYQYQDY